MIPVGNRRATSVRHNISIIKDSLDVYACLGQKLMHLFFDFIYLLDVHRPASSKKARPMIGDHLRVEYTVGLVSIY